MHLHQLAILEYYNHETYIDFTSVVNNPKLHSTLNGNQNKHYLKSINDVYFFQLVASGRSTRDLFLLICPFSN